MKFGTKLLHNGNEIDPHTGAASVPLYQASTYHQFNLDDPGEYDYARGGNPTRKALEQSIAALEDGTHGFAFASGMAAVSSSLFLLSSGDHLVVSEDVYGGTYRVLTKVLPRMGVETSFVDTSDLDQIRKAIRPETRALYLETPSNPTLKVIDLAGAVDIAQEHDLLTMVDNTFLTPYYQKPLNLGIDIVIHSATKFIGGHSDVLAGLAVVKDETLAGELKLMQNAVGAVLGVQDSWLVMRGMKSLKARLDVSTQNALHIAEELQREPAVHQVFYTGLPEHPGHDVQSKQATGHGAVLAFDVGSGEKAKQVLSRVKVPLVAVSLGSVESILSYPAMMSHEAMPAEVRRERGITDGLLRLSVGLEDVEDLLQDLKQALTE